MPFETPSARAKPVEALLSGIARRSGRHAWLVALCGALLFALCAWLAATRLGVTTDTDQLFSAHLPWRQRQMEHDRLFPQFRDLLVAVVDARQPEEADATAAALARALQAEPAQFPSVTRPDASPWLARNAFLFLDQKPLEALLNQTIDAQPFLGQLVADPSARGLFAALNLVALGVQHGQADLRSFAPALGAFHTALADALAGHPRPLSWQRLLAGSLSDLAGPYRFVLIKPRLDFSALEPGGAATARMRAIIAGLPFVASGQARVRITGAVALSDEEFATVAHGMLYGLLGSLLLVMVWLFLAVRSWRLMLPILATLLLGLIATTGFAAAAVGTLNLISVAFAILFIGIAVDFAIQFSVRYRSERLRTPDPVQALAHEGGRVGQQILIAASATSAGFLAFVPTSFSGVAELGLIAGVGMLVAFACTMVFLPAGLTITRPRPERGEVGFAWGGAFERRLRPARTVILAAFGALALLGAGLLPELQFDSDPLHTKDPHTEAMQTLRDLADNPVTNPYDADVLAPDLARADALAARLRRLPLVAGAMTMSSFVPTDQAPKLAAIADAADILAPTLTAPASAAPVTPHQVRASAKVAHDAIVAVLPKLAADDPLRPLADDLAGFELASDATVMAANDALVRFLPMQLDRLRTALTARPVTAADVPPEIRRDWVLPDGRARVDVQPKAGMGSSDRLRAFADQVRTIAPDAGGAAVTIVETARTIISAFRTAALGALAAITVILFLALRRLREVVLVLAPLLLSALLTVVVVVTRGTPLNFANIIALPLLLGVGVSFNIYFVMNWREGGEHFLDTATARAVMFSALTTGSAFGSLALSGHPGTASMGVLLLTSLGCTVISSLVFMPVLLGGLPRARRD